MSRDLGADLAVDARSPDVTAQVLDATGGRGADLVTDRFPLEAVAEAFATAQRPRALKVVVDL